MKNTTASRAVKTFLIVAFLLALPVYAVAGFMPKGSASDLALIVLMFTPAAAAIISRLITKEKLHFGRPKARWIVLGTAFPVSVGAAYYIASLAGVLTYVKSASIINVGFAIVTTALLTIGEELGWRGYLLPNLRENFGFVKANLFLAIAWLLFHVPVILLGKYGNDALPMYQQLIFFTMNIFAFSFIVGIIWEYSRDIWMSVFAHASWNTLVEGTLAGMFAAGSPWLVGEFGILPFVGLMFILAPAVALFKIKPPAASKH